MARLRWWQLAVVVAVVAFAARLMPVLRSGGLAAINQYDAGVYFGSAVALVHGHLPYRDFLLLHPPGSTVALAPFAALTYVVSDSTAMTVARLAWMGLGAANAVLVARIVRPWGLLPAAVGGLGYALCYPAVTIEQTTRLEGLAATCVLGALALLIHAPAGFAGRSAYLGLAGALLGLSASVKVWGVVPLVVVGVAVWLTAGWRRAARLAGGAAVVGTAVCVPFLLAAPRLMWRYVVTDQLGRGSFSTSVTLRLADLAGLGPVSDQLGTRLPLAVALVVGVTLLAAALTWTLGPLRVVVVLLGALVALLLSAPSWFPHYSGLVAGPAAIVLGAATAPLLRRAARRGRGLRAVVVGLVAALLVPLVLTLREAEFGRRFDAGQVRDQVAALPGCVTSDDPSTLIAMDVLSRNLRRQCRLVLDLGGYSYDLHHPGQRRPRRERDQRWQRLALDYLGSGSAAMVTRYSTSFGFSPATARTIRTWPVLGTAGRYKLRRPVR